MEKICKNPWLSDHHLRLGDHPWLRTWQLRGERQGETWGCQPSMEQMGTRMVGTIRNAYEESRRMTFFFKDSLSEVSANCANWVLIGIFGIIGTFEVRFEVCMNAHKKSKSSGNPGPRSSNLQLWMSKARVRTAETLRLWRHSPKKRVFFISILNFCQIIFSLYVLSISPYILQLLLYIPWIVCKKMSQVFGSSEYFQGTHRQQHLCLHRKWCGWIDGLMGWRFEDFLRCPQSTWIWLGGCQVSNSVISIISHLSLDVIQCHPVILSSHSITRSAAARLFAEDHGASDRIKPTAGFLPAISPP